MNPARLLFLTIFATGPLVLAAGAGAQTVGAPPAAQPRVLLAQSFDPYGYDDGYRDRARGGARTFVDDFGRRVTVDSRGRIIAVEQPRERRFEERRDRFRRDRTIILQGTPGPNSGLVLEGPVGNLRPGDRYVPADPYPSDSFGRRRIEASPLPDDDYDGRGYDRRSHQPRRDAALPGDGSDIAPGIPPGGSIIEQEGTTAPEHNPAPTIKAPTGKDAKVQIAALQVILDRAGTSPGVIDGRMGSNVDKAAAAYKDKFGKIIDPTDPKALAEALDASGGPAVTTYTITAEDVTGPYVASIPEDYAKKAELPKLAYQRPSEMLAERFHMDEGYLKEINPGADFTRQGTIIKVMAVGSNETTPVARIVADKGREQVRAYDDAGKLVVAYPSTIGSTDTPSPSGTVQVSRIAFDPSYTYNPKINFKQGDNNSILTIPPGPNGPVGSIWIALSKPTYGIHGTPEPSLIGKTNSHGCVRLTNWDAQELAKLVKPGVTVEFAE